MSIAHLHDRALIKITGGDAKAFLQGLITADVDRLSQRCALYGALLTPQGKILFDFYVIEMDHCLLIDCSASQREGLMARLGMYKLRREVTIETADDLEVFAIWPQPVAGDHLFTDPRLADLGARRYGARAPVDSDDDDWRGRRIAFGVAEGADEIGSAKMFPHEANLDVLNGVSFTKGCFVGQEVVSRMQHRGTARSRVIGLESQAGPIADGVEVTAGGRRIGEVLAVASARALALVRLDRLASAHASGNSVEAGELTVQTRIPTWVPLPG